MSVSTVSESIAAYPYAGKTQKASAKETANTGKTSEASEAGRLDAFKKEIWKEFDSLSWGSSISIQITDEAYKKMMNDSEFKNKMMNLIREDARGSHIMCGGTMIHIDDNGYHGYSYMADHAKEANAAYESHSKDSFYSKKVKKQDADDVWEQKWLDRERQRERLDKEYVDKLYFNRNLFRKEQASAAYEANVMIEPVGSSGLDCGAAGANA